MDENPLVEMSQDPVFITTVRGLGQMVGAEGDCRATLGIRPGQNGDIVIFASIEGPLGVAEFTLTPRDGG